MATDTSEKGLEALIERSLLKDASYVKGSPVDFDRSFALDVPKLLQFLKATQPKIYDGLGLDSDGPKRLKFLSRVQGEIAKQGVIHVLRHGVKDGPHDIVMFFGSPSPANKKAKEQFDQNIFSVTRQLRYSKDETQRSLDMAIFINGLPIATFELKNSLTTQTVDDAIQQYRRDRNPKELLFQFGRCTVHFAVDDSEVRMCTHLKGKASWFLPFNKGWNGGAGNPPNSKGLKTDYLWKQVLTKEGLTDIIENYAQVVEFKSEDGKKTSVQVFPRFHQLDVVHKLLADAKAKGVGRRYLIEHSAGSGKSNSIAWLAHQLVNLEKDDKLVFDSIIVVTDRVVLDKQIKDTIKQFAQVAATVGHADRSGDLKKFLADGKKIIITTVQKFPFVLEDIGNEHKGRKFAIIIDEAHSSQGGRTAAKMNIALSGAAEGEDNETVEDQINRIMEARKILKNASYFAFTATPKNKTLEIFGEPEPTGSTVKHRPFHSYTMKQAIQEGFILDVLQNFTPVHSYYKLRQTVEEDPQFDSAKAKKKLRKFVEAHPHSIREKAEIMVDHFLQQVIAKQKIGGRARSMVVTGGIKLALEYFKAVSDCLAERKSPWKAIVAFSGEHEYGGAKVTEASMNGFPSNAIPDRFKKDPYRFLVVADKFQTGYDEPLLHTMYVDKPLSDIKAVQTLSRLNRAHPQKHDTFVLDFLNEAAVIQKAFEPYYRTTILCQETDPNTLNNLQADLDAFQVYSTSQVEDFVRLYLTGAPRDALDPILDACVAVYIEHLDEDQQVDFKAKAKMFCRIYSFLSAILPYTNAKWEKLATFLNFLIPKLPAPKETDLSKGILEAIDMDSYRVEVESALAIGLPDQDAEINPVPTSAGGKKPVPQLDNLSSIIAEFNNLFGNINWTDADRIQKMITKDIPDQVAKDKAYKIALKNPDRQNARIEHDKALKKVMLKLLADDAELYKQFAENPNFKKFLADTSFKLTFNDDAA